MFPAAARGTVRAIATKEDPMMWLTWRQFRGQAIAAAAGLAVLAVALGVTGPHLARLYAASGLASCSVRGSCAALTAAFLSRVTSDAVYPALYFLGAGVVYAGPAVIGMFWGAPLVARELEVGTFGLTWNQSVTRVRWMAVKLGLVGLAAVATAGLLSIMTTWWASPITRAGGLPIGLSQLSRFSPVVFATSGITPMGYAAFAFVLGAAAGMLIRRTVPAIAVTLAIFAALQVLVPLAVRPHLLAPVHVTAPVDVNLKDSQVASSGQLTVPVNLPGAWVISNQTITPAGRVFVLPVIPACQSGTQRACDAWLARQHLRRRIVYQPASRFWAFQGYETAIFLALALGLAAGCIWWVRYRLS
jgi:hypothetical protein